MAGKKPNRSTNKSPVTNPLKGSIANLNVGKTPQPKGSKGTRTQKG